MNHTPKYVYFMNWPYKWNEKNIGLSKDKFKNKGMIRKLEMLKRLQVMNCKTESSFDQIICHSGSHISKPNESNILQGISEEKVKIYKACINWASNKSNKRVHNHAHIKCFCILNFSLERQKLMIKLEKNLQVRRGTLCRRESA